MPAAVKVKLIAPEKFWKLPINEQRIMVAQDVIEQIRVDKYVAERGNFFCTEYGARTDFSRAQLRRMKQSCYVCGLGACLVSVVRLGNEFVVGNHIGIDEFFPFLTKIFDAKTLVLIEVAFEGGHGAFKWSDEDGLWSEIYDEDLSDIGVTKAEFDRAARFDNPSFWSYMDSAESCLLLKIMENIIANDGVFVP